MPSTTNQMGIPIPRRIHKSIRPLAHGMAAGPLIILFVNGLLGRLGANPIEALIRDLGQWALIWLMVSLAVTPLRKTFGWSVLAPLRRVFGLWSFAYALIHVMAYVGLDHFFDWSAILQDVYKRLYITLGLGAFLILSVLALTSPRRMVKAMGGLRWQKLHRTVYLAVVLAVLHYFYMVKADWRAPAVYAVIGALLLLFRLFISRNWHGFFKAKGLFKR